MPHPKRRHTRSRRDSRRSQNWKLSAVNLSSCPQCGALRRPHHVCPFCGFYRDRVVVPVKGEKEKKEQKG